MRLSVNTASEFARRQWQRRLRTLRPVLVVAVGVGLLVLGGWVVGFSSWLATDTVKVAGVHRVPESRVVAAAEVDLGTPLLRLDLGAIRDRVAVLPEVAEVSVQRSWPTTLSIEVTERQPVATVHRDGSWWVMDGEGVVFGKSDSRGDSLPVVEVQSDIDADALAEVASVVTALPVDLLADVRRLTARSMDSISLRLRNDSEVRWGSAAQSERKVAVLGVLLAQVKAEVYDVSVPELPTTSR